MLIESWPRVDARGAVLDEHPLGAVRRPDADPVAFCYAERVQTERAGVDLLDQLRIAEAATCCAFHQRLVITNPAQTSGPGSPRWCRYERQSRGATGVRGQRGRGRNRLVGP
jgi:hypothetical protein